MIEKIYVLKYSIGEYSDNSEVNAKGFLTKEDADYYCKSFQEIEEIFTKALVDFRLTENQKQTDKAYRQTYWNNVRSNLPENLKSIVADYPCREESYDPCFYVEELTIINRPHCFTDEEGTKHWMLGGKHHREDGPALEFIDGSKYWYINDQELPCKDQGSFLKILASNVSI